MQLWIWVDLFLMSSFVETHTTKQNRKFPGIRPTLFDLNLIAQNSSTSVCLNPNNLQILLVLWFFLVHHIIFSVHLETKKNEWWGISAVWSNLCQAALYATNSSYMKAYRHRFDIKGGASNDEIHQCSLKGSGDPDLILAALTDHSLTWTRSQATHFEVLHKILFSSAPNVCWLLIL